MRNSIRLNIQIAFIFAIIIAAFVGSAMFFSYLNTDSVKQSVETETRLSSVILSSAIRSDLPEELALKESPGMNTSLENGQRSELLKQGLADRLTSVISRANYEVGENVDLWVVDHSCNTLYENISKGGKELSELISDEQLTEMIDQADRKDDLDQSVMMWIGNKKRLRLNQQLLMIRPIFQNSLYLVICNRGTSVHAMQRRQFTLFASIEIILMIAMLVVLANTLFSYRRRLIQLATTDELTGLSNRKSFNETYKDYIRDTLHNERDVFSVFLIDIDYFKQINDTYGHAAGDLALSTLAGHIRLMTESYDGFAGRWGGDEFIGVLPISGDEANHALRQLCGRLKQETVDGSFNITISAGVAQASRAQEPELAGLSDLADSALYVSKKNGRDQSTLYMDGMETAQAGPAKQQRAVNGVSKDADDADNEAVRRIAPEKAESVPESQDAVKEVHLRARLKAFVHVKLLNSILLGVKWMAPFVAGGGLLIGLAFLFDAWSVDLSSLSVSERTQLGSITPLAASLKGIGDSTFNFMLPVFAGFMAYGLAGESAFLAGFAGGFMTIQSNAGFIGAMVAGLAAGVIASEINKFIGRMPRFVQKAAPIVIFPIFNLLLMQAIASLVITPVASSLGYVFKQLLESAAAMNDSFAGAVAGGMMAVDMGGIINKVAYNMGVSGLASGKTEFMASVMAGGMVPPVGIALSLILFKKKYTEEERERTAGTLFMGLSFITEGALPFVFSDVLRVIPCCIAGSALAGLLCSLYGCQLPAPHGGIFVLPVMSHPFLFLTALSAGSAVTALLLGVLKKSRQQEVLRETSGGS